MNKIYSIILLLVILLSTSNLFAKNGSELLSGDKRLQFVENKGQITNQYRDTRNDIQFSLAAANGLNIFIGNGAIHYQWASSLLPLDDLSVGRKGIAGNLFQTISQNENETATPIYTMYRMDVELINANKHAQILTEEKQDYCENYFTSRVSASGTTANAYDRIIYKNVYPNIDWVLYTNAGQLKYEFVVHYGGNVSNIKLKYGGATTLNINDNGSLTATTPLGTITEQAPYTYQKDSTKVSSSFKLDGNILSYETGDFNGELIIDPVLDWATYYGGSGNDFCNSVTTDNFGNVFLVGSTQSTTFIATTGAHDVSFEGSTDAFLVKFNSAGVRQWATYYGGSVDETGYSVDVDLAGNVLMSGYTNSAAGIATTGAHDETWAGNDDAFLVKFNSSGVRQWATYYGGSGYDQGLSVAVDDDGNILMSGYTNSSEDIATPGSHSATNGGFNDAFLVKFDSTGVRQWATYYGGSNEDRGNSVAVNSDGNIWMTGRTNSNGDIATTGAHDVTSESSTDAFLVKFNSTGVRQWATYYGGSATDRGHSVAVDDAGNAWLTGYTQSTTNIASAGANDETLGGSIDAFLVKFNTSGVRQWATYFGGNSNDYGFSLSIDSLGNSWLAGQTNSTTGIATTGSTDTTFGGGSQDAFLAKFNSAGVHQWGAYFGGGGSDIGNSITIDNIGNIWLAGYTSSSSSIATSGSYDETLGGSNDAFLVKFSADCSSPGITSVSPSIAMPGTSVTITGTNFNTTPTNNIVYFGATRATVSTASSTSLNVTVPSGATYMPVSINNSPCALTAYSQYQFLPTFDNSSFAPASVNFAPYENLSVGGRSDFTVLTDIDGDGKSDIIVACDTAPMSVYRNTSSGDSISFAARVVIAGITQKLTTGDIDGDGRPDIIMTNGSYPYLVSVYRNTSSIGSVSFATPVAFETGVGPDDVVIGDLNNDGKPDIVVSNAYDNTISVLRNTSSSGTVSFGAKIDYVAGYRPIGLALGDVNADGKQDIVVANSLDNTFSLFRNSGTGSTISFSAKIDFATGETPLSMAIGDITGDDRPDIVVAEYNSDLVSVFVSSSGTPFGFSPRATFATGYRPSVVVIGDVDGDSKADIVVSCYGSNNVGVFRNTTTAALSLAPIASFDVGASPVGLALGDLDGDSKPDIVASGRHSNTLSILRNNPILPIAGTTDVCVGGSSTLSNATTGGTWSSSNVSVATVGSLTGIVTGVAAGTTRISYTIAGTSANIVFSVNAVSPAGTITGASTICSGATVTLSDTAAGGTWSSSNTAVATVDTSGNVTGVALGTAVISYTISGGCAPAIATHTITVNLSADAGTITGATTVCTGASSTLSNSVSSGTWSSSNIAVATIGSTGIVSGLTIGTTEISYTVTNSCGTAATSTILTVNLSPDAGTITGTTTLCTGGVTTLSNATSGGVWSSANTSIATIGTSGVVTGVGAGTTTISYTVTNSCGSIAATTVVTVNATLTGVADITGATALCAGTTTTLANATAAGVWSSSNTSVATVDGSGVVTGIASGTTVISYTITNTCGSLSATHTLTVNAAPVITGSIAMCVGQTSSLSASPSGGTWNSSNTAVATVHASSGLLTGVGAGTAEISYTPGTGCNAQVTVTIGTAPASMIGTMSACQGATSDLDHTDAGGTWSSSNTTKATINSSTGVVTAVSAGTATITYALSAGCYRAATFTILNNPGAIGGTAAMCEGAATTLSCSPGGGTWSSSDPAIATISSTGVVSSVSAGTTTISYLSGTGCAATRVVTVNTLPDAITGTTVVCVGGTTTLGCAPGGGTWTSYFASRASVNAATGVVTGMSAGTSIISYSLAGGCRRTTIVTVAAAPAAITGSLALCVGSTTDLNCGTTGGTWSAVTSAVATINSSTGLVSGIGTGTSVISYVTSSGCARTAVVTVSISGSTITGDAVVCVGQTNGTLSSGMTGGTWASSNTTIASVHAASGLLTGISAGNANITYTRTPGCYNIIEATVNAAVGTITGAASVAAGATTTLTSSTGGGTWSSTNTLKATVNPTTGEVTGVTAGTTTISYLVSTGCYRARTMVITATRPGISSEADAALTVLKVYPNPTAGKITIEAPVSGTFTVYTIEGRQVVHYPVSTAATTVSLPQNLATGVYLCRFNGEDGSTAMVRLVYQQ